MWTSRYSTSARVNSNPFRVMVYDMSNDSRWKLTSSRRLSCALQQQPKRIVQLVSRAPSSVDMAEFIELACIELCDACEFRDEGSTRQDRCALVIVRFTEASRQNQPSRPTPGKRFVPAGEIWTTNYRRTHGFSIQIRIENLMFGNFNMLLR